MLARVKVEKRGEFYTWKFIALEEPWYCALKRTIARFCSAENLNWSTRLKFAGGNAYLDRDEED